MRYSTRGLGSGIAPPFYVISQVEAGSKLGNHASQGLTEDTGTTLDGLNRFGTTVAGCGSPPSERVIHRLPDLLDNHSGGPHPSPYDTDVATGRIGNRPAELLKSVARQGDISGSRASR